VSIAEAEARSKDVWKLNLNNSATKAPKMSMNYKPLSKTEESIANKIVDLVNVLVF